MEIELKYPAPLLSDGSNSNLGKPEEVEFTQSTVGIDINNNNNKNKNTSNSLPIDTYNNTPTTITNNPLPVMKVFNSDNDNNNSSIGYVAWDFAGQLEYSTLHPVSN